MKLYLICFLYLNINIISGQSFDTNTRDLFSENEVVFIYDFIFNKLLETDLSVLNSSWDIDTLKKNNIIFLDSINIISHDQMIPYIKHIQAQFDYVDFKVVDQQIDDLQIGNFNFQYNKNKHYFNLLFLEKGNGYNLVKFKDYLHHISAHFSNIYQISDVFVVVVQLTSNVISNKSPENYARSVTEPVLFVFERCPKNGMINFVRYYNLIFVGVPSLIEGRINHKFNILAESCYCY